MKRSLRVAALVALCGESVQAFLVCRFFFPPSDSLSGTAKRRMQTLPPPIDNVVPHLSIHCTHVIYALFSFFSLLRSKPTKCGRILHNGITFSGVFASTHEWASTHIHSSEHGVLYGTAKPCGSACCTFDQCSSPRGGIAAPNKSRNAAETEGEETTEEKEQQVQNGATTN